jgi:hypothetical protein
VDGWWARDERERKQYGRERREGEMDGKKIIRNLYGEVCIVFEILG